MAAAIVPLVASLAPSIISLIVGLVHKHAPEAQAASPQPGTGPVRFADVLASVLDGLQKAAAAGQISPQLPTDDSIKTLIEAIVQSMKQPDGPLAAPVVVTSPGALPQTITLKPGQTIIIGA